MSPFSLLFILPENRSNSIVIIHVILYLHAPQAIKISHLRGFLKKMELFPRFYQNVVVFEKITNK